MGPSGGGSGGGGSKGGQPQQLPQQKPAATNPLTAAQSAAAQRALAAQQAALGLHPLAQGQPATTSGLNIGGTNIPLVYLAVGAVFLFAFMGKK
jgi:hypothetical protein